MKLLSRIQTGFRLMGVLGVSLVTLLPAKAAPVITLQPTNQTVIAGHDVNIKFTATGGNLSFRWLYNGSPLAGSYFISTVAGNNSLGGTYSGDGGAAISAGFSYTEAPFIDDAGNLYISDAYNQVVRKVDVHGIITTVAGNINLGQSYVGDGGAATNAGLFFPGRIHVDHQGNLYIPDWGNNVIRKVDTNGIITTVAGNNSLGGTYSGDGGAATNAGINSPSTVAVDSSGNLFFSDTANNVIRKVDTNGIITTVIGVYALGGGYSGDGGAATNAAISYPSSVTFDGAGNLYIAEAYNNIIRKVDTNGIITTVAGNHSLGAGYSGDGGAATNATFDNPNDVVVDKSGNFYVPDYYNNVVRKVDASGIITTFAGNNSLGGNYSGDGGLATNATLNNPTGVALDSAGNLYIGDAHNNVIRKVTEAALNVNPTNGSLTLTNVQAGMSGNYQVIVSNASGSVTSSIVRLTILTPAVITAQPVSQTVVAGDDTAFEADVTGTPPLQYQWTFNGGKIAGATNTLLTLTNIHPSQAGKYSLKVTSPAGTVTSSNAQLTVIARNILIYNFSSTEKYTYAGHATAQASSGQLFFLPDSTNGTFVGWGVVGGKKRYWVTDFPGYGFYTTIAGPAKQVITVFGQAGQTVDGDGNPSLWSTLYKGQSTQLTIATHKYYSFPGIFSGSTTEVYSTFVGDTSYPVLHEASSSYVFATPATQQANNTGQTLADLFNALIKSLTGQGYKISEP